MEQFLYTLQTARDTYSNVLVGILRYGAPILACILLLRCLTEEDLRLLPMGGKLAAGLKKLHLLK